MRNRLRCPSVRVEVVTSWSELASFRDEWSALLGRSSSNEPTLSPTWLGAWWQTFGNDDGRKLRVALVFRGDRLVGLAPLYARRVWYRNAIPLRRLELLGSGERQEDEICSDYINIIAEAGQEPLIARAVVTALVRGQLGGWDELVLDTMNANAPMTGQMVQKLASAGCKVTEEPRRPCPYVTLPGSWDEYLAALSGNGRYTVRRALRDLEKWAGDSVELVRARDPAEVERGLAILVDLHGERWQQAGREGVFRSEKFLAFHRQVMPELLAREALDLLCLRCKGEPVASVYNIVWNNKVYFYQSGRRTDLPRQIRPGIAIHGYAIQHAIAQGRTVYDFLSGVSQYKSHLSTAENPLVQVRATPRRSLAALLYRQAMRSEDAVREVRRRWREYRAGSRPSDERADASSPTSSER